MQLPTLPFKQKTVALPKLLSRPPIWRLVARFHIWYRNKRELRRAEKEFLFLAMEYEKEAEKWNMRQHHALSGEFFERAAGALAELFIFMPNERYRQRHNDLLLRAVLQYEAEIKKFGDAPDICDRLVACYADLKNARLAEHYAAISASLRQTLQPEAFQARQTIILLRRAIIEQLHEGDTESALDSLDEIIMQVPTIADNGDATEVAWVCDCVIKFLSALFWDAQYNNPRVTSGDSAYARDSLRELIDSLPVAQQK